MNKNDRRELQDYVEQLEGIKCALEEMQENEECKLDNMPESLQESERGEAMQEAIETLEGAVNSLDEAIGYLTEITEG